METTRQGTRLLIEDYTLGDVIKILETEPNDSEICIRKNFNPRNFQFHNREGTPKKATAHNAIDIRGRTIQELRYVKTRNFPVGVVFGDRTNPKFIPFVNLWRADFLQDLTEQAVYLRSQIFEELKAQNIDNSETILREQIYEVGAPLPEQLTDEQVLLATRELYLNQPELFYQFVPDFSGNLLTLVDLALASTLPAGLESAIERVPIHEIWAQIDEGIETAREINATIRADDWEAVNELYREHTASHNALWATTREVRHRALNIEDILNIFKVSSVDPDRNLTDHHHYVGQLKTDTEQGFEVVCSCEDATYAAKPARSIREDEETIFADNTCVHKANILYELGVDMPRLTTQTYRTIERAKQIHIINGGEMRLKHLNAIMGWMVRNKPLDQVLYLPGQEQGSSDEIFAPDVAELAYRRKLQSMAHYEHYRRDRFMAKSELAENAGETQEGITSIPRNEGLELLTQEEFQTLAIPNLGLRRNGDSYIVNQSTVEGWENTIRESRQTLANIRTAIQEISK
tara:strand:- start:234 stop:1790 length:1557 start_codon:yes stop_codon:yes gene_type:complete